MYIPPSTASQQLFPGVSRIWWRQLRPPAMQLPSCASGLVYGTPWHLILSWIQFRVYHSRCVSIVRRSSISSHSSQSHPRLKSPSCFHLARSLNPMGPLLYLPLSGVWYLIINLHNTWSISVMNSGHVT